ncbi:hypothetical protein LXA43DRAFT_1062880 [Ganoderma leucocontextum]|nr:hypothetical protein LXA43DRAFT_1062880 [Ganoderma leucocontextum]
MHLLISDKLYVWRIWTVSIYGLSQHVQLFLRLKPVHMSSDEAEDEESDRAGNYTIIKATWQSHPLKTFLHSLDNQYIKGTSDARVLDSVAPIGLWRNCYNETWVQRQDAWVIRDLCIIDEDYDFSLNFSKGAVPGEVAVEMQRMLLQAAELDGTNVQNGENGEVAMT